MIKYIPVNEIIVQRVDVSYQFIILFPPIDLAEYVLNKCIIAEHSKEDLHCIDVNYVDGPSNPAINTANQPVRTKFDFLEDQTSHEQHENHILVWMVSNQNNKCE